MIVEAQALVELDADSDEDLAEAEERLLQDEENGPPMLRVRLTGAQARAFAKRALDVVNAGPPAVPAVQPPARPGRTRMPAPERIPPRSVTRRPSCAPARRGRADRARPDPRGVERGAVLHGRARGPGSAPASTSRSPASGPCGTSPTAPSPSARSPRTRSPRRPAGASCRPPCCGTGPYGEGMCQLWIEAAAEARRAELLALVDAEEPGPGWKAVGFAEVGEGRTALLVHADDQRLRRLAVLDAVINNGDRKGGHLLPAADGRLYAHRPRRHLQRRGQAAHAAVGLGGGAADRRRRSRSSTGLAEALARRAPLAARLAELITAAETRRHARAGGARCCASGRHPSRAATWPRHPVAARLRRGRRGRRATGRPGCARQAEDRPRARPPSSGHDPPGPVRMRNIRPVTLMTCMPGPLLRSPPCLARAATSGSTTPRPAVRSPSTPVPSPVSTSAASRRTTRPTWVTRRPTTRSTSCSACGSTPSGRFTTSRT